MTSKFSVLLHVFVVWLTVVGSTGLSFAEEAPPATVLTPFVNGDTFAVGYLDLAAVLPSDDGRGLGQLITQLPWPTETESPTAHAAASAFKGLHAAGAEGLYVVVGLGDICQNGGPLGVVTVAPGRDPAAVESLLHSIAQLASATDRGMPKILVRRHGSGEVLVGSEREVARYEALGASPRPDLSEPLAKLVDDGAALAVVLSPGPDFRRVIRELWPVLPPPLAELRGGLIDRWLRLEFAAAPAPLGRPAVELVMQATDAASAQLFARLLRAFPEASEQMTELGNKRHDLRRYLELILEAVPPEVDDTRVVMRLPSGEAQVARLQGLLSEATSAALESARRRERMQQFKQMGLAMQTYADAKKHLVPPAICDQAGRPLLSWRVAVLPYLEQNNLYKQFHLDEPWDSPHNLALIHSMPAVYSDPAYHELTREGKTTYVVPVGKGTVFDTKEGITFRDIRDGTSKTIMIVEVPPERAVVWTKPEDWEVDMDHPLRGVARTDRDYFVAAWCDASTQVIPTDVKPDVLRANLTRAGLEMVDRP